MQIAVSPPLGADERGALERALALAGVEIHETPEAYRSAWRVAAALEAVDNDWSTDASTGVIASSSY